MPTIKIDTIRGVSKINRRSYPMYCGFLSAVDLLKIADVPSFARNKLHHQIATDISHLPVDQWQRPLDETKTGNIKEIYSKDEKDNLMANPVLIGIAALNIDQFVFLSIEQRTAHCPNGEVVPLENYFSISVNYTDDKRPLWILDGQHRLEGMKLSEQRNEPIPFVLLYDERLYSPPFLAEIFTQVTTGATPMAPLHAEWMKYAFRLDKFAETAYEKSMDTTISLCKEVELDGVSNPFHNKIQFNPYLPVTGYYAFVFNMSEWVEIIAENYFGKSGTLTPKVLAAEVVKSVRALEDLDQYRNKGSKLFSNDNPHKILAEGFLSGLLKHLLETEEQKTLDEWKSFYLNPGRALNRCRWNLPFVRTPGALSSGNGVPSKIIAKECFDLAFNDPSELNGALLTDFLAGEKAYIKLTGFGKTAAGRLSSRTSHSKIITPGGVNTFDLSEGGTNRDVLRVESETVNCHIISVTDPSVNPPKKLGDALKKSGLDVSRFTSGQEIDILSMNYSGDTTLSTKVRLFK
jgi:hypothetical protein